MNWLRLSIVVLTLSSITWSFQCSEDPDCDPCRYLLTRNSNAYCPTPNDRHFKLRIRPNESVAITCLGNPNWTDLYLGTKNPEKRGGNQISFHHCDEIAQAILAPLYPGAVQLSFSYTQENGIGSITNVAFNKVMNNLQILHFTNWSRQTEDTFEDFENLPYVDLSANNLQEVTKNLLGNSNLRTITLWSNQFKTFEVHTFDGLANLKSLRIWQTKVKELLPHTFDELISLVSLDMEENFLSSLPDRIFEKMRNLTSINLSKNNFTGRTLNMNLFKDNVELQRVTMTNNKRNMTSFPNGFFANLTKLESVELGENGLIYLPKDLFWGTTNLRHVSIGGNFLKTLPSEIFKDTTMMRRLDLSINNLSELPDDVFEKLQNLQFLDVSVNHLTSINEKLFAGLRSLQELRMNKNGLKTIDIWAFNSTRNLILVSLEHNELTLQSTTSYLWDSMSSPFHVCSRLEKLDLSHNNLSNIFEDWRALSKLKFLDLSYNQLQVLRDIDLRFSSPDLKVDLDYNNVDYINLTSIEDWAVEPRPRPVWISIQNNPIRCDCRLYDLLRYLEGRMDRNVNKNLKLLIGKSKCHSPYDRRGMAITDLQSKTLKCNVSEQDFGAECPNKCSCYIHPEINTFIVNCSYKGLMNPPWKLDYPLNRRIDHIELNLTGNYLTKMPNLDQNGYNKVTTLTLDHNNISTVTIDGLSNKLKVLNLNNNNITRMNLDVINFLENAITLKNITLKDNPWLCDCDAHNFLYFIKKKRFLISDFLKVKCKGYNSSFSDMTPELLCPTAVTWIITTGLMIAFVGIIIGLLIGIRYRYQKEITIWMYAHPCCLWSVTEDELDSDKVYDAFVSYSHKDDDFVENNILRRLEEGPRGYKLCVHTRDWLAGEWIPEQIAYSVENSRRTIVILTPNFIESIWGRMEFRVAHQQALSDGRLRVVIVIYGDIGPTENLDPELKYYLKMNTYIKWGDPWFWEKLEYALPRRPKVTKDIRGKYSANSEPGVEIENI